MKLSEANLNTGYMVKDLKLENIERRRLLDLGFTQGSEVKALYRGIFNNPTAYLIKGSIIALRDDISNMIMIGDVNEQKNSFSRKPECRQEYHI